MNSQYSVSVNGGAVNSGAVNSGGGGNVSMPREVPMSTLIRDNLFESVFLSVFVLIIWFFIGHYTVDKKSYYISTSITFGVLVIIMFISKVAISFATVMAIVSGLIFCWYAYDTYTTYKESGQDGLANTQVLLMVSLLATIVISKFVLSSRGGKTIGLPEIFSIFFTIVSFLMIYLINNLTRKACLTVEDVDYESIIVHAILYLTIYSLTGKHPLIALAVSVATFAYFSYSSKVLSEKKSSDSKIVTNERGNLIMTTLLIIISIVKVIFPTFSLNGIIQSSPVQFMVRAFAVLTIIVFITANMYYTIGADRKK